MDVRNETTLTFLLQATHLNNASASGYCTCEELIYCFQGNKERDFHKRQNSSPNCVSGTTLHKQLVFGRKENMRREGKH